MLKINNISLLFSMFCLAGNQMVDNRISFQESPSPTDTKAMQIILLRQSIEQYSSKIELIQSEIENKLFYENQPYKVLENE